MIHSETSVIAKSPVLPSRDDTHTHTHSFLLLHEVICKVCKTGTICVILRDDPFLCDILKHTQHFYVFHIQWIKARSESAAAAPELWAGFIWRPHCNVNDSAVSDHSFSKESSLFLWRNYIIIFLSPLPTAARAGHSHLLIFSVSAWFLWTVRGI